MNVIERKRLRRMTPKERLAVWRAKVERQGSLARGLVAAAGEATKLEELAMVDALAARGEAEGRLADEHVAAVRLIIRGRRRRIERDGKAVGG